MPAVARVFGVVLFERADRGALDVFRRREVGLAGAEVDHVHAAGLEFFRCHQHRQRRRDGNPVHASESWNVALPWVRYDIGFEFSLSYFDLD